MFREEKARNHPNAGPGPGGPTEPAVPPPQALPPPNKISVLLVCGPRISEETIRRRLATYEPFSFQQEPDDEK